MIRKADKYLLLFLLMIGFLQGNATEGITANGQRPTANDQRLSANDRMQDTLPPVSKPNTRPSGVIIITPGQGMHYRIGDIYISGNKVTRSYIITREFPFKSGDSLTLYQLTQDFTQAREHLINTRLFNEVTISLKEFRGYTVDINVEVKERWYIFPLPYVRPVDRNFTAWAEQGYSLKRFDYGLKYSQYNFTGRND